MKRLHPLAAALGLCFCAAAAAQTAPTLTDTDRDGVPDLLDNCVQVANPDQRDSNGNGSGDRCDGDVNGDGLVNAVDLAALRQQFGQTGGSADLNGDGSVNALDLALLRSRFGQRPGPVGEVLLRVQQIDPRAPPEGPADRPESPPPEASAPALLLPQVLDAIDDALPLASGPVAAALLRARPEVQAALTSLSDGASDGSLAYLVQSMGGLRRGHAGLSDALAALTPGSSSPSAMLLVAVQQSREAAQNISGRMLTALSDSSVRTVRFQQVRLNHEQGVALLAAGQYGPAMDAFERAIIGGTPLLSFSIDRFEQRLRSVFDAQSVGWSYAIARAGTLERSGAMGLARTAANPPATLQTENKRLHVASVSKTLSAIVTLHLLADLGLTADATIGPWLPSNWVRGAGVNALRFRDLMTHRSGFGQNDAPGSSYASLQAVVALPVGANGFDYDNANFGLLRVLVSRLAGINAAAFPQFDSGVLTAAVFLWQAQALYGGIGVPFFCSTEAVAPALQYRFPDDGTSGYLEPDRTLQCGGYGVNISAMNLARVLSFWRYTNDLLPNAMRNAMRNHHLGLMDPAQFGFAQGTFGVYHGHGGDWDHGSDGLDSCMYSFPNLIEASVVVNSSRKTTGHYSPSPHQCGVLKWAYEGAWVAN